MAQDDFHQDESVTKQNERIEEKLSKIKHIILVMSGKGGVGKSSVAVNVSVALSRRGLKVGLMDIDLHGPNTVKMLGLEKKPIAAEGQTIVPLDYSENLKIVSIAPFLETNDTAVIWRGPLKIGAIKQFISDVKWDELDFLLIDSPPGTGDEPLTVAQVIHGAKGIIVTTPQEVSILDIRKSINFCKQVDMPILGIIENMSSLVCPHCGKSIDIFSKGGGKRTASQYGIEFLGEIPFIPEIVSSGDKGQPYVLFGENGENCFKPIVDKIIAAVE